MVMEYIEISLAQVHDPRGYFAELSLITSSPKTTFTDFYPCNKRGDLLDVASYYFTLEGFSYEKEWQKTGENAQ